ncbi:acryloyl-CoA reductase [Thiospirochaeta perfilievii]|uniref:Acryloyl-CoA reductase n=1 Tax=Thiospirochaeta perfilievii TaxID=252967 RepID=A0A5C1Q772_9SPIO|nr:YhdH/YhfP family quinone oxidoreductase [Thiospirochaeta perfilievii]QEN03923.1 acryloyl-CoA reductase [Thiospirochaeta perfilievii]
MEKSQFKAFVVTEKENNFIGEITQRNLSDLPNGELLIKVHYSSLNYKDALSVSGNRGVTKNYPHTPGIDAVGVIVESEDSTFSINEEVIVTSYDLGMNTDGGFGEYIRVPSAWVVKLPKGLSMKEAMIYGTAGLTAGISILRLTQLIKPNDGDIVVTGATGGVGSLSIAILNKLGYFVTAVTGKESEKEKLIELGAKNVISRSEFENTDKRPLLKPLYIGAIDTVGGTILENIIKTTIPGGVVTCCGNVASPKLDLTVFPFILRGVTLIGIDSQNYPMSSREIVWEKLAGPWKSEVLLNSYEEITFDKINEKVELMLKGKLKGRTIIRCS